MKFRTQLLIWYGGALVAALLVLIVHGLYEIYEHSKHGGEIDGEILEVMVVELAVGIPLAAAGVGLAWWMSRRMLRKLEILTAAAAGMHAGNLEVDLPLAVRKSQNELDKLMEVFREMTVRLRDSFAQTRDFTLNASHELKTPLAVMRGEVETEMRNAGADAERIVWMESLLEEIDRLARVVDGLTFLAKVDAGQVPLRGELLDFAELVRDAGEDASLLAGPHGLKVECVVPEGDFLIHGDRHRLRQVMLNLVDNAVKYNKEGGFVRIALAPEGDGVRLEVENAGAVIPAGMESRVFERFFRIEASHASKTEGSGLGLHITQWIVRGHGGEISLATGSDGVTRARVLLPRRPPAV